MYTEKKIVGYWNPELEINDADDVRGYDVVQEHSMIGTETEHIGSKVKESKRQK